MKRDGMSVEEADEVIAQAKRNYKNTSPQGDSESAHNICEECFGLEPDYLTELV